jgi:hypothetical protein
MRVGIVPTYRPHELFLSPKLLDKTIYIGNINYIRACSSGNDEKEKKMIKYYSKNTTSGVCSIRPDHSTNPLTDFSI